MQSYGRPGPRYSNLNFRNHCNDTFSSLLLNVPQLLGKYLVVLGGVVGEVVADVGADLVVLPLNHVHRVLLCVPNNKQAFQGFDRKTRCSIMLE